MNVPPTPTVAHLTWQCTDPGRTLAFLSGLFGWAFQDHGGGYYVAGPPTGAWIGVTQVDTVRTGNAFVPHVAVPNLDVILDRARSLQARIVQADGTIDGVGRYADIADPDGSVFTVIQFVQARPSASSTT